MLLRAAEPQAPRLRKPQQARYGVALAAAEADWALLGVQGESPCELHLRYTERRKLTPCRLTYALQSCPYTNNQ